jgi:hypothetical protein
VSTPRRGRGRRDNGLDAALWAPVRDVDPRVGEHLLDVLREEGIAAYLEPSADVEPYTRTVSLPSPPTDRVFVDRSRRVDAQRLLDEHADDHPAGRGTPERFDPPVVERTPTLRDAEQDAEWARIVAAYELEHGRTVVSDEPVAPAPGKPSSVGAPPDELRPLEHPAPPEEHYEPPAPPPLSAPAPASLYAVLLIAVGALLVIAPGVVGLTLDVGIVLGVAALVGGAFVLVSRMRERSTDDDDDGAVV